MMKNVNNNLFLKIIVGISIGFFLIIAYITKATINKDIKYYLGLLSDVITIDSIFIFLFTEFFWKARIFYEWLVPFPNITGTWKGTILSTWVDPITGCRPDPIPVVLCIKQNFFNISCVMRTEEMTSYSFCCDFTIDRNYQIKRLIYSYDSVTNRTVADRNPRKYGTINFDILNSNKKLYGNYWTDLKTTGTIDLDFWQKKVIDYFPKELIGHHPVSRVRDFKS